MKFINQHCYHVYNQGNDRGLIFFTKANYYFFTAKLEKHVLPYAHILAYCLMPNHFHLMLAVKENKDCNVLNHNIGILLRSYTRAINIQETRTGSLFRQGTKCIELFSWDKVNEKQDHYMLTCFNYIHQNPVKAGLVFEAHEWKYSSAKDYKYRLKSNLVNSTLAHELGLIQK